MKLFLSIAVYVLFSVLITFVEPIDEVFITDINGSTSLTGIVSVVLALEWNNRYCSNVKVVVVEIPYSNTIGVLKIMYLSPISHVNISFSYNEDLPVHLKAVILCDDERIHFTDFYIDKINETKVFFRLHEFVERRVNVSATPLEVLHSNIFLLMLNTKELILVL
jgi:hypothetical protein